MIQRKQTLFLFQLVFFGIALLFIANHTVVEAEGTTDVFLVPFHNSHLLSTPGHTAAIALNFITLLLAFAVIFLYKKRELQVRLSYLLMALWLVLTLMLVLCPFVQNAATIQSINLNWFAVAIGAVAIVAAFMAIRFIKKDIALLKSADRIR